MTRLRMRGWQAIAAGACVIALGAGAGLHAQKKMQINGAGATFPDPIYQKWFAEYNKLHPEIQINYNAVGSGAGVRQISAMTVFFGASDATMTNDQLIAAPGKVMHFPTVLGAVVPIYNIPNVTAELKFTPQALAGIYLGQITKWNDPKIAASNAGVTLPSTPITVVHRAEGSGTSYIFCDFLAKVVPEWKTRVGVNTAPPWPVGLGGQGSDGVTAQVKQIPGAIGYVELVYALQSKLSYGQVQNHDGNFVRASLDSVTAAAAAAAKAMPPDFRVSIVNAPGANAYPISSFTWMLFYESPKDKVQGKAMVDFMKWALGDGQKFAGDLGYAPLPTEVVKLEMDALAKIKVQ
jgi:phosphate transport system substrate-binding protein